MEYYSAVRKKLCHLQKMMVIIMVSKISQTGKDKLHVFSYMKNLDFKKKNMKEKRRTIWEEKEGQG
jgi:hypothetical protein